MACGVLVPQPRIKPVPSAVEAQSPNHWTTRRAPRLSKRGIQGAWEESHILLKQFRNKSAFLALLISSEVL